MTSRTQGNDQGNDQGWRSCSQNFVTMHGEPIKVTFDKDGMPSVEGMEVACARDPEEARRDGMAWISEAEALNCLGFKIVSFGNAILIFNPK